MGLPSIHTIIPAVAIPLQQQAKYQTEISFEDPRTRTPIRGKIVHLQDYTGPNGEREIVMTVRAEASVVFNPPNPPQEMKRRSRRPLKEMRYDLSRKTPQKYSEKTLAILKRHFDLNPKPSWEVKAEIAQEAGLDPYQVNSWFSNRRKRFPSSSGA